MKKKFELWIGYLGNGLTVCNRAIERNGEYKHIAHISNGGNVNFYVKPEEIPGGDLLRIEHNADTMRSNFLNQWQKLDEMRRYEIALDHVPHAIFMQAVKHEISHEALEKYYLDNIA